MSRETRIKLCATIIIVSSVFLFISIFDLLQHAVKREVVSGQNIRDIHHFLYSFKETPASYSFIISVIVLIVASLYLAKLLIHKKQ